jgi:hypothetical protein
LTSTIYNFYQASAFGGSMSVVHVGANVWSFSFATTSPSSSTCEMTSTSGVSVNISDTPCSNCSALTTSGHRSYQANAYGGSMSVVHVGANAWSFSEDTASPSSSTCGATSASGVIVAINHTPCFNCSAVTSGSESSSQANAYGGSMSVVHVGAYAWSYAFEGKLTDFSRSHCDTTWVTDLSVIIADSSMLLTKAVSSKHRQLSVCIHL